LYLIEEKRREGVVEEIEKEEMREREKEEKE